MATQQREIKFKIYHKGKLNGYERLNSDRWQWMAIDLNPDDGSERWVTGVFPHGNEYERKQFTGLKDKHGKEIYEGDIIRWVRGYADDSVFDLWPTGPYIVKFENGKFFMHCTPKKQPGGYILNFDGIQNQNGKMIHSEVIGNIYESPELLES